MAEVKETMLYMDERVALKDEVSDLLDTISVLADDLLSYQESIDRLDVISLDKVRDLQSSLVTFSDICEGGIIEACQFTQASLGFFIREIEEDRKQGGSL
tara:strand:- start:10564 stop:10863 length:300 start_codon:yes stop_codon:yes gene_type:complete